MSGLFTPGVRAATSVGTRLCVRIVYLCLLMMALASGATMSVYAAASEQRAADEPPMILLGEYYFQRVAAGHTAQLQVRLPQAGVYLLTSDDLESASYFTLTLFDESGRELYSDAFAPLELELDAARYMLQFQMTAPEEALEPADDELQTDDTTISHAGSSAGSSTSQRPTNEALLSFVMLGNLGAMSGDEAAPGQLYNGGFYRATDVDGPRYGVLSVPDSPYPQEVNLSMAPAGEDEYFVLAQGEDIDAVSIDTTKTTLLRFWTQGGDYALRVLPVGPASEFTLVPFLSGPPPVLTLGEPEQGVLPANTSRVIYQIVLDEFYGKLALTLDTDATNIRLRVTQPDTQEPLFTTSFGASELTLADLEMGVYYVTIESITPGDTDVAYLLQADGVAGTSVATLISGTITTGTLEADDRAHLYEFPVVEAGSLITATLIGDAASNFHLAVGGAASENIWRSTDISATDASSTTLETVFIAPSAGTYLAEVSGNGGAFFALQVQEGNIVPALTLGEAMWGRVEAGRHALYRLQVDEPDQLLTLLLVGSTASDPALHVTAYDESGMAIYTTNSKIRGEAEAISRAAAPVGLYEVAVDGGESGFDFFLLPRLEAPATLAIQWALATVIEDPAASAVLGAPNASRDPAHTNFDAGDNADSKTGSNTLPDSVAATWSPPADGVISLNLTYAHPVTPNAVTIYTDAGMAAVVAVEAYNTETSTWVKLWEGSAAELTATERVRTLPLAGAGFTTDQIRLLIDTTIAIPAIDAVALVGLP